MIIWVALIGTWLLILIAIAISKRTEYHLKDARYWNTADYDAAVVAWVTENPSSFWSTLRPWRSPEKRMFDSLKKQGLR